MANIDDEDQRPLTPDDEGFYEFYATNAMTTWVQNPLIDIPYQVFGQMVLDLVFRAHPDLNGYETASAFGPDRRVGELRRVYAGCWGEASLLSAEGFWCEEVMSKLAATLDELMADESNMMVAGSLRCDVAPGGVTVESLPSVNVYFLYAVRPSL